MSSPEHATVPDEVDFNFYVKFILAEYCFPCHGPDPESREAELSLHTPDGLYAMWREATSQ